MQFAEKATPLARFASELVTQVPASLPEPESPPAPLSEPLPASLPLPEPLPASDPLPLPALLPESRFVVVGLEPDPLPLAEASVPPSVELAPFEELLHATTTRTAHGANPQRLLARLRTGVKGS